MKKEITVIIVSVFILFANYSFAQNTGKITGKVTDDKTGESILGVNVLIEGTSLGASTDMNGDYIIVNVPPKAYDVVAKCIGYANTVTRNVRVSAGLTTKIDFKVTQTSVTLDHEVVVVAHAPLVVKDMTSTEARINADQIKELPLQNINQLISQQAGVSKSADGGLHIRGGRSSEISYLVNGISITDDFSRTQALTVETESIQELKVISGTFNAEYGNAMSGVVNIVTKSGGDHYSGNLELWSGDYVSNNSSIYQHIQNVNPLANYNFQGFLNGPIIPEKLTFFVSARRFFDGGYIFGENKYSPQGRAVLVNGTLIPNPGDNTFVSMNSSNKWSGQATLDWKISGALHFKMDSFGSTESDKIYNHLYQLNPNGSSNAYSNGYSFFGTLTHVLFTNTFHELTFAYKANDYSTHLYDDLFDPRYVSPDSSTIAGYHFLTAGTDLNHFNRSTKSTTVKWDLTSQIDKINLAKIGVQAQFDKLFYENITLIPALGPTGQQIIPFVPAIPGTDSPQHDKFERNPFSFSAYMQDKIEFSSVIINVGLRFDLFDPQGKMPIDASDPDIYNPFKLENTYHDLNHDGKISLDEEIDANKFTLTEREAFWYKKTTVKTGLSPRFGIAYPITDQGIIRFSFGIFQQIPDYGQLYIGDQFKLTSTQGIQGSFGNNDLKPQRTTIYEIGLQQQLTNDIAVDVTAYYRDIRDWISSSQPIPTFVAGISYSKRINRDFANARGVTLSIKKRFADYFSFGVDYTFQIAEGTNSSPEQEFFSQQNGAEPTRYLTPLDWDQTHTLNTNIYVGGDDWGVSLISAVSTGQPYTPTITAGAYSGRNIIVGLANNSRRKPLIANFDMQIHKDFSIASFLDVQLFLKVFNLLDAKNPLTVYGDTGKPDYTLQQKTVTNEDPSWFVYPNYYSAPRSIYLGTKISFNN
ncbi:MAG: TonB-dependent receptor [Ignavibacteriaceae bacterium]|jgi:outer membrane receptor protein involved in Fe transport